MHRQVTPHVAALTAIAAFALTACAPSPHASDSKGASPRSESPSAAVQSLTPHASSPTLDPAMAPDILRFTATTLDGQPFDGASLYGRPTIVWFWAPWCPYCQDEAPGIAAALASLPDGVQAIGIPGYSDAAAMQKFVDDYGLGDMLQVVDADGSLWSDFSVATQPATALIAADGTVTTIPGSGTTADFLAAAASIAP